jgi:hypothetical protein
VVVAAGSKDNVNSVTSGSKDHVNYVAGRSKDHVNSVVAGSKDAVKTAAAGSKDAPSTKAIVIVGDPKRLPRPPVAEAAAKAVGSKCRRLKGVHR